MINNTGVAEVYQVSNILDYSVKLHYYLTKLASLERLVDVSSQLSGHPNGKSDGTLNL